MSQTIQDPNGIAIRIDKPSANDDKTTVCNGYNQAMRIRKIRVKPPTKHVLQLNQMMGIYRHLYNQCVQHDRKGEIDGAKGTTMREWRAKMTKKENYMEEKPWIANLPSLGRQQAIEEFFKAKKENLKRCAAKKIKRFHMQKKSKYRSRQECVPFERHRIRGKAIELCVDRKPLPFRIVGKLPKEFRERNDGEFLRKEVKLIKDRLGKWYIAVPVAIGLKPCEKETICALDPGVRTFQTAYGTDGAIHHIGSSFQKIEEELLKADEWISRHAKIKDFQNLTQKERKKKKQNYRYRYLRCFERVRNRISDLHHKVASWLCKHYRIILLPKFETQNMVSGDKLQSPTCRKMMTWSHYKFKQRLIAHAQHAGSKVFIVNEHFTSQTCGQCGNLHTELGGNKRFECPSCKVVMDRDANAARNILLRNLQFLID